MDIHINNIGKIQKADLRLDAITVIAGLNNTGKSTVGRALYLYIHSLNHLDDYIERDLEETIQRLLSHPVNSLHMLCMEYSGAQRRHKVSKSNELKQALAYYVVNSGTDDLNSRIDQFIEDIAALYSIDLIDDFLKESEDILYKIKYEIASDITETLSIGQDDIGTQKVSKDISDIFEGDIVRIKKAEEERSSIEIVNEDGFSNELFFSREKKDGIDECTKIARKYAVNENAIYIDSPKPLEQLARMSRRGTDIKKALPRLLSPVVMADSMSNIYEFADYDQDELTVTEQTQAVRLLAEIEWEINHMTGGHLRITPARGLQFEQEDSDVNRPIKIMNLSNGIKSFMLLGYALECGCLREGDVLILDEPEINLHPEWQIRYASILVRLQKLLYLKILITTHTPYFLEAIETASEIEKISENCHYYQAKEIDYATSELKEVTGQTRLVYDELAEPFQELEDMQYHAHEENS